MPDILTDGQSSWDGGVDASKVTSMMSEINPNGLDRNQLAWLINATSRNGRITCRNGWDYRQVVADGTALMQGGYVYKPVSGNAYLVALIGGITYRINLEAPYAVTDLTGGDPTLYMPATVDQAYFVQGEEFLVIQAGDWLTTNPPTLPLFWDGVTLRRSIGVTSATAAPGTPGVNEIPGAGPMEYFMGRIWYTNGLPNGNGRIVSAGDIVGGNSGTVGYRFRDAILNVTENPLVVGGDGFAVPTNAGRIRALKHSSNIDATLGEGQLYIFTREQVYSLSVPVTRSDWIDASSNNQPLMKVVQFVNGAVNDRSIVAVNGDLFYQSLEPAVRSLMLAIRYYQQWGNTALSANEDRILNFNDRALMHMATGVQFDKRLLQSVLPKQTAAGVAFQALIPLDFDPISSFQKKLSPAWEGHWEGLDFLQLFYGDFGGLEKCFALVVSRIDGTIQLWEITNYERFNHTSNLDDVRITWNVETPSYHFSMPQKLKQLVGGELWLDRVHGTVEVKVYYRPDADTCWTYWHRHEFCVAKSTCEDVLNPVCYPESQYAEGYKFPIVFPTPPAPCDSMHVRPSNVGYQFQVKLVITGWCSVRSIFVYASEIPKGIYQGLMSQNTPPFRQAMP